jgi:cobalt-zinc-cadmium efflux system outer membrane protein
LPELPPLAAQRALLAQAPGVQVAQAELARRQALARSSDRAAYPRWR